MLDDIHYLLATEKLSDVPARICKLMESSVCVIWKPSRSLAEMLSADGDDRLGRLYPYSSNFLGKTAIQHAGIPMEITKDTSGRFYLAEMPFDFENNFREKDAESPSEPFMGSQNLLRVCMARFKMPESANGDFVVSVYRKKDENNFDSSHTNKLQQLSGFLPLLYQRLVASQLRQAIENVNEILRPRCEQLKAAEVPLKKLCTQLAAFFCTGEVSAFMREGTSSSGDYRLVASTLHELDIKKRSYTINDGDGLTGYVLARKTPIWFHDLHNFDYPERRKLIERRYPGICWTDGADYKNLAGKIYGFPSDGLNPPLQFAAVPVIGEKGDVLGVIRASFGTNPFYFLGEQIEAFRLIATEIGRWWESILHGVEQKRRADVWEALDKTITKQHDTLKSSDDIHGLINQTVHSIAEQPGFDLVAFRRGRTQDKLHLVALKMSQRGISRSPHGEKFTEGTELPIMDVKRPERSRGFFVDKIERNAGQISVAASPQEKDLFQGLSWILSCPVYIKNRLYGVLDVGFQDERDYFPAKERIHQFVELVVRQLALFERIAESVEEVEAATKNELKTYAVVTHQLKTPLFTASRRLRGLVATIPTNWHESNAKTLVEVAGMVRKARGVTNSIEILGKLVAGKNFRAKCYGVNTGEAWKLCLEIARNVCALTDVRMKADFELQSKDQWGNFTFQWEADYAEQCLDAVVNNAFKYNDPGKSVRILAAPSGSHFMIRVVNRGAYSIRPNETEICKTQGWRGNKAKEREGVGIGLWIADCLMAAQGGELRVNPTTGTGETFIDLLFLMRK